MLGLDYAHSEEEDEEEEDKEEKVEGKVPSAPAAPSSTTSPHYEYQEPAAILHPLSRPDIISSMTSQSALPAGFFDDHTDDLEARGVDIHAAAVQLAQHEDSQLAALLDEVDAVESSLHLPEASSSSTSGTLVEEYEVLLQQQETSESEMMNAAVQMAYEAKVASLLVMTDRLKKKRDRSQRESENERDRERDRESGEGRREEAPAYDVQMDREVDSLLQYMEGSEAPPVSTGADVLTGAGVSASSVVATAVEDQLQRRKEERRRLRVARSKSKKQRGKEEEKEKEEKYVPLDFMDWTSKDI